MNTAAVVPTASIIVRAVIVVILVFNFHLELIPQYRNFYAPDV